MPQDDDMEFLDSTADNTETTDRRSRNRSNRSRHRSTDQRHSTQHWANEQHAHGGMGGFPQKSGKYDLEEQNCSLQNIGELLGELNSWIHDKHKYVQSRTDLPDSKEELAQVQVSLSSGWAVLQEREQSVTIALDSAFTKITHLSSKKEKKAITEMANMVKRNWEQLKKDYKKLRENVEEQIDLHKFSDVKINELYAWSVDFYKMCTSSIEEHLTLALEEQLYILKSYDISLSQKMKVLVELDIEASMKIKAYAKKYHKIGQILEKVRFKIEDRKGEVEHTIEQLNEFELAVDKGLAWLTKQEIILRHIVIMQDEDSLELLKEQREEVIELLEHVEKNMESITIVLKTGQEMGLEDMNRFSLFTKLTNLDTRWVQLDTDCRQKLIQIELNILSIREYSLLQWLVMIEEQLTVSIETITKTTLDLILIEYRKFEIDYNEIKAQFLLLEVKVDKIENQELKRDIKIIETHWINVYELLMAAFAMLEARVEAESDEEDSSSYEKHSELFMEVWYDGPDKQGPRPEQPEAQAIAPLERNEPTEINVVNIQSDQVPPLNSAMPNMPAININVDGGNIATTNAQPPAESNKQETVVIEKKESRGSDGYGMSGMAGGGGFQLPVLPQMQYQHHHCCEVETVTETEVDSSRFLSAIMDLRSWITSHKVDLEQYNNDDVEVQLQWLTDLYQVLVNQEITIRDTHSTIKATLPKLTIVAKEELTAQIEGMLEDFRNLKSVVEAKLHQTKVLRNDYVDFEDTMAQFEEELLDMEDTCYTFLRARVYNFDQIIDNITDLAELEGKLELWRSLFDKGLDGAGCPMIPPLITNVQMLGDQWATLFEKCRDLKMLLKNGHDNVTKIESDLRDLHEWIQIKESEIGRAKMFTTLEELEQSCNIITTVSLEAQAKRAFFEPPRFTSIDQFHGVCITNLKEFYASLGNRVVTLWQDSENLVLSLTRNVNIVTDLYNKCQNFIMWSQTLTGEIDKLAKPENLEESQRLHLKLEDFIDIIPQQERELELIVNTSQSLDSFASVLLSGAINTASKELNILKVLLKKKHSIVSDLLLHFKEEVAMLAKIEARIKETENILNSPILIPCNVTELNSLNDTYKNMEAELAQAAELIEQLAEHNPELAKDLRERCNQATKQQHQNSTRVDEAMHSLTSLHEQMDDLIYWEQHILTKLGEVIIPAGERSEVYDLQKSLAETLKDIERKDMTYKRIVDKTNTSLIEFELGTGQVLEEKLEVVESLWAELKGLSEEHRKTVDKVIGHFKNFDASSLNHQAFLQSQQSHYNYIAENVGSEEAAKRSKKLQEEVAKCTIIEDMNNALKDMKKGFPGIKVNKELDKMLDVKKHQVEFTEQVKEQVKVLENADLASIYEGIPVDEMLAWTADTLEHEVADTDANLPGCIEDTEIELDKHERILADIAQKQKEIIKMQTESEKLFQEKGDSPGMKQLAEKLEQLQTLWNETTAVSIARQKLLEERLVMLGALSDDLEDQFTWINRTSECISEAPLPQEIESELVTQIEQIKSLRGEIGEHGHLVTLACNKGHQLLQHSNNSDKIGARLRDLTEYWQHLNDIARDRHLLLQNTLQIVQKDGTADTELLYNWSKGIIEKISPASLPPGFNSTDLNEMIEATRQLSDEIQLKLPLISEHLDKLKERQGPLKGKAKRLEHSLNKTLKKIDEKQKYLKEHISILDQMHDLPLLKEWLSQSESIIDESDNMNPDDVEQIRHIIDTYSKVKSDVDQHSPHMDSLVDIPTECIPDDYQNLLNEIINKWTYVSGNIAAKQVDMNELENSLEQYDNTMTHLIESKEEIEEKLMALSQESISVEEISIKLQQHKLLTREITKVINCDNNRSIERVLQSFNKILGCDNVFSRSIEEYKDTWDLLVDRVNDQRNQLTEYRTDWIQFNDSCSNKLAWITERFSEIDELVELCEEGNPDTLNTSLDRLKALYKTLDYYENQIEQIYIQAESITNSDHPQLQKLRSMWDELREKTNQTMTHIESCYNNSSVTQSLQSLFRWLGEKEEMSVLRLPIPKDLDLLHKDTENLKLLFNELEGNADKVERLIERDTDVEDVKLLNQVELLEQKWNRICDVAAAREEEMKEIRIRLEEYEQEFERVCSWLDEKEEKLSTMQLSASNESMLEQYLGELDDFLKLETIAQTELQGLKEGARRLHGENIPNKVTNALSRNCRRWNSLCQQAKSTKINLQQRLRSVLRQKSELDDIVKALNCHLSEIQECLSYVEQKATNKEVFIEKERMIEKSMNTLTGIEEDYNLLHKLMLTCPVELHDHFSSHLNVIEETYTKVKIRHKMAVQNVSEKIVLVNQYGKYLDDTTGTIVSILSELQDRKPFCCSTNDLMSNLTHFKDALSKSRDLSADVRSLQTDSLALPFYQEDINNLKDRLSELEKFTKDNIEVLLNGNDMVTQFKDYLDTARAFINDIYQEVEEGIKPQLESDSTQVLYNVENDIKDILQCIQGKNYLIDDMERSLNSGLDETCFNMEALHAEYEDVITTWLGLQNDLESYKTKLTTSLASKTTYKTLVDEVKEMLRIREDSLRVLNDVDNEEKLKTAVEILSKLMRQDNEVNEKLDTVALEGKKIIRSIDKVSDMKSLQQEITSIQSMARNIQDNIVAKQRKYAQLVSQVQEFKASSQKHLRFICNSIEEVSELSTTIDKRVIENNKAVVGSLESKILDKKMEHDNIVRLGDTVLRTLKAETRLTQITSELKENWHSMINNINEATLNIETSSKNLNSVYTSLSTLKSEVLAKQAQIINRNSISTDMTTLRRQHREMRLSVRDIENYTSTVERTKLSVENILETCSVEVREDVVAMLDEFNTLWRSIKRQSNENFSEIDQQLGGVKHYSEVLNEENGWLTHKSKAFDSLISGNYSDAKDTLLALSQEINLHYSILIKVKDSIIDPSLIEECSMLVQDCIDFKSRVDIKLTELDAHNSITYKVLNNVEQMIRQVYERKRNLDSHQLFLCRAVSTNYDTILFQSAKLKEYKVSLASLQSHVEPLLQSSVIYSEEIMLKLDHLREAWLELGEEVSSREHQICQMMELLGNFENNFTQLNVWLEEKKKVVSHSLPEYYQGLVSHTDLIISIKSTLDTKTQAINSVKEIGEVIIAQSSAADVEHVQNKLHHITQEYDRFNILLDDCIEEAKEAQSELELFDIQLGKIYQKLEHYHKEHEVLLIKGLQAEEVKKELLQLLQSVQDDDILINNLTTHVKKISIAKWDGENVYCQTKLTEIRATWEKVVSAISDTIEHIEQSSVLVEKFLGSIDNIMNWVNEKLEFIKQPTNNQDTLAVLTSFRESHRDVKNKEVNIHKAMENGAHLLVEDVDCSTEIETKLEKLNNLYKNLTLRYEEHSTKLEAEYRNYSKSQNKIDAVQGKLSRYEETYFSSTKKSSCVVEEVEEEIQNLKKSEEELCIIQQQITDIENLSSSDQSVGHSMRELKTKINSVNKELKSKIKSVELHKTNLVNINQEMHVINSWTDISATKLLETINEETASQLETVRALRSDVDQKKSQLQAIKKNLHKFLKERKPNNSSTLTRRLIAIEENFSDIEESIIEREQICEEEIQNVENFQKKINIMCEEVFAIDQKLASNSKLTLNQEEATSQLEEHNTIQQNVASMQSRVDDINTTTLTNLQVTDARTRRYSNNINREFSMGGPSQPDFKMELPKHARMGMTASQYDMYMRKEQSKAEMKKKTKELAEEKFEKKKKELIEKGEENTDFEELKKQMQEKAKKQIEKLAVSKTASAFGTKKLAAPEPVPIPPVTPAKSPSPPPKSPVKEVEVVRKSSNIPQHDEATCRFCHIRQDLHCPECVKESHLCHRHSQLHCQESGCEIVIPARLNSCKNSTFCSRKHSSVDLIKYLDDSEEDVLSSRFRALTVPDTSQSCISHDPNINDGLWTCCNDTQCGYYHSAHNTIPMRRRVYDSRYRSYNPPHCRHSSIRRPSISEMSTNENFLPRPQPSAFTRSRSAPYDYSSSATSGGFPNHTAGRQFSDISPIRTGCSNMSNSTGYSNRYSSSLGHPFHRTFDTTPTGTYSRFVNHLEHDEPQRSGPPLWMRYGGNSVEELPLENHNDTVTCFTDDTLNDWVEVETFQKSEPPLLSSDDEAKLKYNLRRRFSFDRATDRSFISTISYEPHSLRLTPERCRPSITSSSGNSTASEPSSVHPRDLDNSGVISPSLRSITGYLSPDSRYDTLSRQNDPPKRVEYLKIPKLHERFYNRENFLGQRHVPFVEDETQAEENLCFGQKAEQIDQKERSRSLSPTKPAQTEHPRETIKIKQTPQLEYNCNCKEEIEKYKKIMDSGKNNVASFTALKNHWLVLERHNKECKRIPPKKTNSPNPNFHEQRVTSRSRHKSAQPILSIQVPIDPPPPSWNNTPPREFHNYPPCQIPCEITCQGCCPLEERLHHEDLNQPMRKPTFTDLKLNQQGKYSDQPYSQYLQQRTRRSSFSSNGSDLPPCAFYGGTISGTSTPLSQQLHFNPSYHHHHSENYPEESIQYLPPSPYHNDYFSQHRSSLSVVSDTEVVRRQKCEPRLCQRHRELSGHSTCSSCHSNPLYVEPFNNHPHPNINCNICPLKLERGAIYSPRSNTQHSLPHGVRGKDFGPKIQHQSPHQRRSFSNSPARNEDSNSCQLPNRRRVVSQDFGAKIGHESTESKIQYGSPQPIKHGSLGPRNCQSMRNDSSRMCQKTCQDKDRFEGREERLVYDPGHLKKDPNYEIIGKDVDGRKSQSQTMEHRSLDRLRRKSEILEKPQILEQLQTVEKSQDNITLNDDMVRESNQDIPDQDELTPTNSANIFSKIFQPKSVEKEEMKEEMMTNHLEDINNQVINSIMNQPVTIFRSDYVSIVEKKPVIEHPKEDDSLKRLLELEAEIERLNKIRESQKRSYNFAQFLESHSPSHSVESRSPQLLRENKVGKQSSKLIYGNNATDLTPYSEPFIKPVDEMTKGCDTRKSGFDSFEINSTWQFLEAEAVFKKSPARQSPVKKSLSRECLGRDDVGRESPIKNIPIIEEELKPQIKEVTKESITMETIKQESIKKTSYMPEKPVFSSTLFSKIKNSKDKNGEKKDKNFPEQRPIFSDARKEKEDALSQSIEEKLSSISMKISRNEDFNRERMSEKERRDLVRQEQKDRLKQINKVQAKTFQQNYAPNLQVIMDTSPSHHDLDDEGLTDSEKHLYEQLAKTEVIKSSHTGAEITRILRERKLSRLSNITEADEVTSQCTPSILHEESNSEKSVTISEEVEIDHKQQKAPLTDKFNFNNIHLFGKVDDIYPPDRPSDKPDSVILEKCQELSKSAPWKEFNILAYNVQLDVDSLLDCNENSFKGLEPEEHLVEEHFVRKTLRDRSVSPEQKLKTPTLQVRDRSVSPERSTSDTISPSCTLYRTVQPRIKYEHKTGLTTITKQTMMNTALKTLQKQNWEKLLATQEELSHGQFDIRNNLTNDPMGFDLFTKFEERYPDLEEELATLNSMWENTCRGCVDRQRQLEESISALDDFWSHYNELRDWLREIQGVLNKPQSPDTPLTHLLHKAEELLQIVADKQPSLEKMKQLAAKVPSSVLAQIDEEEEPLKLELEEAQELYDNQVELIKCRINALCQANLAVSEYKSLVTELMLWLNDFETKLEPNVLFESTDASDIKNLQGKHKVHMKSLCDKQTNFEDIKEQGNELLHNSDETQQQQVNLLLAALTHKWEQVHVICEEKQMKLEDGFQHTHQLEKNFKELICWIQEAETQIRDRSDDNDIHSRVERQQILVSGLKQHEALFNHVFVLGEGLISLCVPTAGAPISNRLTTLEEQWEALKQHCVTEQDSLKGTVDNLMDMRSKLEFYLQWAHDVAEHCDSLDVAIPISAAAIRDLVDELYTFCNDLKQQAPYLNDLVEQCDGLIQEGELSPDLTNDIEDLRKHWAGICQYLDERFTELRRAQITLAKQPAPKPHREPKSDGEKVDLEVQNAVASCCCESKFKCEMIAAGKYKFGESEKKHLVRILRTNIVVRVGGGWETIESFLNQHDPCRTSTKGNIESILSSLPKPGEQLGLLSANLTKNRTVLGFNETTKTVTRIQSCAGAFEQVTETETDTEFAHSKGPQRLQERSQTSTMSSKSLTMTKTHTTERNMFSPVINPTDKGRVRTLKASRLVSPSKHSPAKSLPTSASRSTGSFGKTEQKIPLRKSKSYNIGESTPPMRRSEKVLSERFSTFTEKKGVKRSESDSNIQTKRRSGIPVAKFTSAISRPASRDISRPITTQNTGHVTSLHQSQPSISTFGTRSSTSKLGKLKNIRNDETL